MPARFIAVTLIRTPVLLFALAIRGAWRPTSQYRLTGASGPPSTFLYLPTIVFHTWGWSGRTTPQTASLGPWRAGERVGVRRVQQWGAGCRVCSIKTQRPKSSQLQSPVFCRPGGDSQDSDQFFITCPAVLLASHHGQLGELRGMTGGWSHLTSPHPNHHPPHRGLVVGPVWAALS